MLNWIAFLSLLYFTKNSDTQSIWKKKKTEKFKRCKKEGLRSQYQYFDQLVIMMENN